MEKMLNSTENGNIQTNIDKEAQKYLKAYEKILKRAHQEDDFECQIETRIEMADLYYNLGLLDKAKEINEGALVISKELNLKEQETNNNNSKSSY